MLPPMHPEATRLRATTLHIKRSVFAIVWAIIHFQALSLQHQVHFVYRPPTYQVVDDK
jgi:hypothetical protein